METKTIRFEKGEVYSQADMMDVPFNQAVTNFDIQEKTDVVTYRCLKSFTVQINIIEDEEQ